MEEAPEIPNETLLRMAIISEKYLQKDYESIRELITQHERELAMLSFALVMLVVVDYYALKKIHHRLEELEDHYGS